LEYARVRTTPPNRQMGFIGQARESCFGGNVFGSRHVDDVGWYEGTGVGGGWGSMICIDA